MSEGETKSGGGGLGKSLNGTVDLPVIGATKKKVLVAIAGAAAAFILYRYYRAAAQADEPVEGDSDGDGFADGGILPVVPGQDGPIGAGGGGGGGSGSGSDPGTPDSFGFQGTTNSQWSQYAAIQLSASGDGWTYQIIVAALGKYLAGKPLSATEIEIVQAAIAVAGHPPVGDHPVIPGGSVPVLVAPGGLRGEALSDVSVALSWNAVAGAAEYQLYRGGVAGAQVAGTSATVSGLTASTSYGFQVAALSAGDVPGPKSATVTVKTKATPAAPGPTPPKPTDPKPPAPGPKPPGTPRHRVMTITKAGQTLSHLVAAYNAKYKTKHTVASIWAFNLKYRPASTVKTLKERGPDKVFRGSTFWFPY